MTLSARPTPHDDLHELAAAGITGIVGTTLYGLAAPVTVTPVPDTFEGIIHAGPDLGQLVVLGLAVAGSLAAGWLGWMVLVERRRPRLRPRIHFVGWRVGIPRAVAYVVAYVAARIILDQVRLGGGFYANADGSNQVFVWSPASIASAIVIFWAILVAAYVAADLIGKRWQGGPTVLHEEPVGAR